MVLEQQVGLVLVIGGPGHLRGGHERRQQAALAGQREHLDVEIGERQHDPHAVLLAQPGQCGHVGVVGDQGHRRAHVGGVLGRRERGRVGDDGLVEMGEAADDVVALAGTGEQHGGRAHMRPSQPPVSPLYTSEPPNTSATLRRRICRSSASERCSM